MHMEFRGGKCWSGWPGCVALASKKMVNERASERASGWAMDTLNKKGALFDFFAMIVWILKETREKFLGINSSLQVPVVVGGYCLDRCVHQLSQTRPLNIDASMEMRSTWKACVGDRVDKSFRKKKKKANQVNTITKLPLPSRPLNDLFNDIGAVPLIRLLGAELCRRLYRC